MTTETFAASLPQWQAALWQHLGDGVACLAADGRVQAVNPALARWLEAAEGTALLGLPWPALLEQLLRRCQPDAPTVEDLPAEPQDVVLNLRDGTTLGLTQRRLPDGTQLVLLRDLSAEAAAERRRGEFLAMAAHDLRTPLASLVGFSQLMATRPMGPEQTRELAAIFHRQSTALNALVGDLMDLARLDARGARDFRWRSLAVTELVDEAVQAAALPPSSHLKVTHQQPDALLRADAAKAALALCQVLTHASRQGPQGAIEVHTRAAARARRAGVEIAVRDNGPGLTREELNGAFDRFYRGSDRATQGTGLGLSLAKTIVELHGGSVALTNTPGQGTQLTLWWPAAVAARQVAEGAATIGTAIDATHFPALVTGPSSGANCLGVPPARARRPRRSPPANLLKGGSDEPDDQRAPPRSHPRAA